MGTEIEGFKPIFQVWKIRTGTGDLVGAPLFSSPDVAKAWCDTWVTQLWDGLSDDESYDKISPPLKWAECSPLWYMGQRAMPFIVRGDKIPALVASYTQVYDGNPSEQLFIFAVNVEGMWP